MARFHKSKAPIISRFLSTQVAPNNSNASILSLLETKWGIFIKYSTIWLCPVTAAAKSGVIPGNRNHFQMNVKKHF